MSSYDEESLRNMSYSELRKHAKNRGIKGIRKAESIITSLLGRTASAGDEDSFVTLERSIINSCKKNKENLFEQDKKQVVIATPRRETYTVSPEKVIQAINADLVMTSASPEFNKYGKDESMNITLSRGSEKKTRKSKRNVSFVTPARRSSRISLATPQYHSIKDRPKTPMPSRLSSAKKHVAFTDQGNEVVGSLNFDVSENNVEKISNSGTVKRPSTPMPLSNQRSRKVSATGKSYAISPGFKSTPKVSAALKQLKEEVNEFSSTKIILHCHCSPLPTSRSSRKVTKSTAGDIENVTPLPVSRSPKTAFISFISTPALKTPVTPLHSSSKRTTPRSGIKTVVTPAMSLSSKKGVTPDFNKLHKKNFDKMESIDEYQKRKEHHSAKKLKEQRKYHNPTNKSDSKKLATDKIKKIPKTFSGIPFVPKVTSPRGRRLNFGKTIKLKTNSTIKGAVSSKSESVNERTLSKKLIVAGTAKAIKSVSRENTPLKQRHKFDLKKSLAKKLPYKPHIGPLKPLVEANLNNTVHVVSGVHMQKTDTENVVIKASRVQSREVLQGVRKNRRFHLQMNNRRLNTTIQ